MSCYHPILAIPDYDTISDKGTHRYKLQGSWQPGFEKLYPDSIKVPCGKCIGCKLDYSRNWADRMILELDSYKGKAIFVTLTYNDDHLPAIPECDEFGEVDPDVPSSVYYLRKKDLQDFFKRLRKHYSNRTLRFYACGEYGPHPRNGRPRRPHYHSIIFGIGLDDFADLRLVSVNELGQPYFTSQEFQNIWSIYRRETGTYDPIGYIGISEVSYKTCAYVSRYCAKKAFSIDSPEGASPEFTLMSRRPGIGKYYLEDHPDCLELSTIYLTDQNGSVKVSIPKYYLNQLKLTDPDRYVKLVDERRKFGLDHELLKLQRTSLPYLDLLNLEEKNRLNKTEILFKREE